MNRDTVIRLARASGVYSGASEMVFATSLERFAALVAAAAKAEEREACAKVADAELSNTAMLLSLPPQSAAAFKIAAAIRSRG